MTDDTKVPLWLKFQCYEEETGKTYYVPAKPAEKELCFAVHGSTSWKELHVWLAWRERVAKALGLVEPPTEAARYWDAQADALPKRLAAMAGVAAHGIAAGMVNVAIAAELRRLADTLRVEESPDAEASDYYEGQESGFVQGQQDAADRLRARADELDPP